MFLISAPALAAGLWNVVRPSRTPPSFLQSKTKISYSRKISFVDCKSDYGPRWRSETDQLGSRHWFSKYARWMVCLHFEAWRFQLHPTNDTGYHRTASFGSTTSANQVGIPNTQISTLFILIRFRVIASFCRSYWKVHIGKCSISRDFVR